jgi:hypothetical protein
MDEGKRYEAGKPLMSDEIEQKPFKVRSTVPGRHLGLKEWSAAEIARLTSSYQHRYPDQWRAYVDAENADGFITNEMNDHLMKYLEETDPGLHRKHYRVGIIDFRFANERAFTFAMWQPGKRQQRTEKWSSHLKTSKKAIHENGTAEWTGEQVETFLSYLQDKEPELWTRVCEVYNEIGFSDFVLMRELCWRVPARFAVPEDIDYSSIIGGLLDEAHRRYGFEMIKPENQKKTEHLQDDWLQAKELHTSFDEWRQQMKLQKDTESSA